MHHVWGLVKRSFQRLLHKIIIKHKIINPNTILSVVLNLSGSLYIYIRLIKENIAQLCLKIQLFAYHVYIYLV